MFISHCLWPFISSGHAKRLVRWLESSSWVIDDHGHYHHHLHHHFDHSFCNYNLINFGELAVLINLRSFLKILKNDQNGSLTIVNLQNLHLGCDSGELMTLLQAVFTGLIVCESDQKMDKDQLLIF